MKNLKELKAAINQCEIKLTDRLEADTERLKGECVKMLGKPFETFAKSIELQKKGFFIDVLPVYIGNSINYTVQVACYTEAQGVLKLIVICTDRIEHSINNFEYKLAVLQKWELKDYPTQNTWHFESADLARAVGVEAALSILYKTLIL